jgi:hypothetical protein
MIAAFLAHKMRSTAKHERKIDDRTQMTPAVVEVVIYDFFFLLCLLIYAGTVLY